MPGKYAADTTVTPARSKAEIEEVLTRYGAGGFGYASQADRVMIEFVMQGKRYRIMLVLPAANDADIKRGPGGRARTATHVKAALDQAIRQKWRAMLLVIKAKLEAVASGIATVEAEFLAYAVLPDNQTVGQWLAPQIETVYAGGPLPEIEAGRPVPMLLPAPREDL